MDHYLLVVEYDGSGFSGWQKQPGLRTVQSAMEAALERIFHEPTAVTAAGRTDKGVHALGQAVSCAIPVTMPPQKLLIAMNAQLPKDIAVVSVRKVPPSFNARFDAKQKTYQYTVWNKPGRPVLLKSSSWHIATPLDIAAMRKAAAVLEGKYDFSAFHAAGGGQEDRTVALSSITVTRRSGTVILGFTADRFLYKMVRNMVGTLVLAGKHKLGADDVKSILCSGRRSHAGPTAPPQGLCLKKVYY